MGSIHEKNVQKSRDTATFRANMLFCSPPVFLLSKKVNFSFELWICYTWKKQTFSYNYKHNF